MLAWVLQETPRWTAVDRVLTAPGAEPILPGPALTEVIKTARARGNTSSGEQIASVLHAHGVRVEHPIDADLVRAAALLEVSQERPSQPHSKTGVEGILSLADALILAVVERLGVPVLTKDRYWHGFMEAGHTTARIVQL